MSDQLRVAINARLLSAPTVRGWNRYALNLLIQLPRLGVHPILCSDRPIHPDHLDKLPGDAITVRVSPPMKYGIWEQQWLPGQCADDHADVLHSPFNFGLPWRCPCPRVLTLHDAIEQAYYKPFITWRQRLSIGALRSASMHWVARRSADRFITISNHAKRDLVRYLKLSDERIDVTWLAADERFHEAVPLQMQQQVRAQFALERPYIFYVGGFERRKNIPFLLRAFAESNLTGVDLALGGGQRELVATLRELAESLGIDAQVKFLGPVDDAQLPALYAGAMCFAYPSEYEGFGLQACEAMAAGCPVLAANAASLPEVLGDGGELFPLDDPKPLALLLQRVSGDEQFRAELRQRATRRSTIFSWRQTAEKTIETYRRVLDR